jgi:hypothetical protein
MATLTAQEIVIGGLEATYAAADVAGDTFENTGDVFLHVINGDAGDHTVTVDTKATEVTKEGYGTVTLADQDIVVTAGEERMIGPFPTSRWNGADGKVDVTYEAVTSVTVAVIKLPRIQ